MDKICNSVGCGRPPCAKGLCNSHYAAESYRNNKEHKRAVKRAWQAKQGRDWRRNQHYKNTFGITLDEYNEILASQGGKCAVPGCERTTSHSSRKNSEALQVDHDHKTGKIRGLLCVPCNLAIGHLRDNPELIRAAAEYLEKTNGNT